MRQSTLLLAACCLWIPAAFAADPNDDLPPLDSEPAADTTPTAYACTGETLVKMTRCSFEGEGGKGSPTENVSLLKSLAPDACKRAVQNDRSDRKGKEMHKACVKAFADTADEGCDADERMVDLSGRFTPQARDCYTALLETLQKQTVRASIASSCCRCLAENQCPGSRGPQCLAELGRLQPRSESLACMTGSCSSVCGAAIPRELEHGTAPRSPAPQRLDRPSTSRTML